MTSSAANRPFPKRDGRTTLFMIQPWFATADTAFSDGKSSLEDIVACRADGFSGRAGTFRPFRDET